MSINVHIERLVLEGLPIAGIQGATMGTAVEAELARLLGTEGLSMTACRAEPHLPAANIQLKPRSDPGSLAAQIGGAVYDLLNQPTQKTAGTRRAAASIRPNATAQ